MKLSGSNIMIKNNTVVKPNGASKLKVFWSKYGAGYLFLSPFLLFFLVFTVLPVAVAIVLSLTDFNMLQFPKFIGLTNYKLLFLDDDIFLVALYNTMMFALVAGPIGYMMSFFMAWIINKMRYKTIFALAFYAPSITSGIAMSVIWLYFFSSDTYGLINNFLLNIGIINEPVLWLSNPKTILGVVIFVAVWMSMGTGFLTFLAGLQTLPEELYEAGKIDGVKNRFQELFYITLPQLKPQLLFGAIDSIVKSFAIFDIAITLAGMPSPNYAAHTIVAHLYDHAFIRFEMSYASSIAVVLFAITFIFGRLFMRIFSSKDV